MGENVRKFKYQGKAKGPKLYVALYSNIDQCSKGGTAFENLGQRDHLFIMRFSCDAPARAELLIPKPSKNITLFTFDDMNDNNRIMAISVKINELSSPQTTIYLVAMDKELVDELKDKLLCYQLMSRGTISNAGPSRSILNIDACKKIREAASNEENDEAIHNPLVTANTEAEDHKKIGSSQSESLKNHRTEAVRRKRKSDHSQTKDIPNDPTDEIANDISNAAEEQINAPIVSMGNFFDSEDFNSWNTDNSKASSAPPPSNEENPVLNKEEAETKSDSLISSDTDSLSESSSVNTENCDGSSKPKESSPEPAVEEQYTQKIPIPPETEEADEPVEEEAVSEADIEQARKQRAIEKTIFIDASPPEATPQQYFSKYEKERLTLIQHREGILRESVVRLIPSLQECEMTDADFLRLIGLFNQAESPEDVRKSWMIIKPGYELSISADVFNALKPEIVFFLKLCTSLMSDDAWI